MWDGTTWSNIGPFQGPLGPTGPTGPGAVTVNTPAGTGAATVATGGGTLSITFPALPQVVVSAVAGETPAAPGTAVLPVGPALVEGSVFVNTTDHQVWHYDGTAWVLVGHPGATVTESPTAGVVPGTAGAGQTAFAWPAGSTPRTGDVFVNNADNLHWVYNGTTWVPLGAPGPTVTVNTTAGQTPTSNPPANPRQGDVFVNRPDGRSWIYNGTVWEPLVGPHKYVARVNLVANTPFTITHNLNDAGGNGAPVGSGVGVHVYTVPAIGAAAARSEVSADVVPVDANSLTVTATTTGQYDIVVFA
jgi:hypothetical protein